METQSRNGRQREGTQMQQPPTQTTDENRRPGPSEGTQGTSGAVRSSPARRSRGELMERDFDPFGSMLQLSREMDRLWDSFFGRSFGSRGRLFGNWPLEGSDSQASGAAALWTPRIDVQQREDAIHVHADLPGCRKEDIRIEATDEGLAISGERSQQRQEGEGRRGYQLTERSYGSFYRNIPLPEGAQVDQARAQMAEGVLEITIPLQQPQRRQIRID